MNKESTVSSNYLERHLTSIPELEVGQIVTGTVVQLNDDSVLLDIGYKSEGKVPNDEFLEAPSLGDSVKVTIVELDDGRGQLVVSKKNAELAEKSAELKAAFKNRSPIIGKFIGLIKGGFEVDLGADFKGFCPLSKADIERIEKPESLLGKTDYFFIDKLFGKSGTRDSNRCVVSRRAYLETIAEKNREDFFNAVQIGDVVQGEVKTITKFGAFINLGGFDGLLHINDITWGHIPRISDYLKVGQVVQLRLISINPETKKIGLSLKHMTQDPWESFEEKYRVGDVVTKPVTKVSSFGFFVELEPGIEGLVHVSELSWSRRNINPSEFAKVGDMVSAKILGYDFDARRVSLGVKQLEKNPWDSIEERYPVGKVLIGKVVKTTDIGAFINIEEGIDGFLHVEDVSWTKRIKKMSEFCKEGDNVEVAISKVDPAARKIRLSVKLMEGNPWETLKKNYPRYSEITGVISSVTDFGVFVKVPGEIEGLISKQNLVALGEEATDEVLSSYKNRIGESITAMVMDVNVYGRRLTLSIKDLIEKSEKSEVSKYMAKGDDDGKYNPFASILDSMNTGKK